MSRIPEFDYNDLSPEAINNWIIQLHGLGLDYHFDDDPVDVVCKGSNGDFVRTFTDEEANELDAIMESIYSVKGYDPFETLVLLSQQED